jgi:hypothetical protein
VALRYGTVGAEVRKEAGGVNSSVPHIIPCPLDNVEGVCMGDFFGKPMNLSEHPGSNNAISSNTL